MEITTTTHFNKNMGLVKASYERIFSYVLFSHSCIPQFIYTLIHIYVYKYIGTHTKTQPLKYLQTHAYSFPEFPLQRRCC